MSSLKDVFAVLEEMREQGIITAYAIGGATAVLFYAEPTRTYDVDVFVTLPAAPHTAPVSLDPVYARAEARGMASEGEHLLVEGVPVQVLPAYNALIEEAIAEARVHDYEGVPVRVVGPERHCQVEENSVAQPARCWDRPRNVPSVSRGINICSAGVRHHAARA